MKRRIIAIGLSSTMIFLFGICMSQSSNDFVEKDDSQSAVQETFSIEEMRRLVSAERYAEAASMAGKLISHYYTLHGFGSFDEGDVHLLLSESLWRGGKDAEVRSRELAELRLQEIEKNLGLDRPEVATELISLAVLYFYQGQMLGEQALDEEAEAYLERALTIRIAVFGLEQPAVADVLDYIGWLHQNRGNYDEAEDNYRQALNIREKTLGPDDPIVAVSLLNLVPILLQQGRALTDQSLIDRAELYIERALTIREKAFGHVHPDVAACLSLLGLRKLRNGNLDEAERLWQESVKIMEQAMGKNHLHVSILLRNLGVYYRDMARYAEGERVWRRIVDIQENHLGSEHPDMSQMLSDLSICLVKQGKYDEAEGVIKRGIKIEEDLWGPNNNQVAMTLTNLAVVYDRQARIAEQGKLLRRILDIWQALLPPEHPNLALGLMNVASYTVQQGDDDEAILLYHRALEISQKVPGGASRYVTRCLRGMGDIYGRQGRFTEAESLLVKSLTIAETGAEGRADPDVADNLMALGNLYLFQGELEKAEQSYQRALDMRVEIYGDDHRDVAYCLDGLAEIYILRGEYSIADSLYQRALSILERSIGPEHPDLAQFMECYSELHRLWGNSDSALSLSEKAAMIQKDHFASNAAMMSEADALAHAKSMRKSVSNLVSSYIESVPQDKKSVSNYCNIILSTKGQVSDEIFQRRKAFITETDSATLALAESLRLTKFMISQLFVEGPGEDVAAYRNKVDSLQRNANDLEADLYQRSASFRKQTDNRIINTDRIATCLPRNSALIEYLRFDYQELTTDSPIPHPVPHYLAVVVDSDGRTQIMNLGKAELIDPFIGQYRRHFLEISTLGGSPTPVDNEDYEDVCKGIYAGIWHPLEPYLANKDVVFIAPDGALNMVSFAGLIDADGKYLIENHTIHYLSAARDLIRLKEEVELASGLFALGDPDFDAIALARLSAPEGEMPDFLPEPDLYAARNIRSGCGELNDFTVAPLPGTRREIEVIAAGWDESAQGPIGIYTGARASEERFKTQASGNRIIHLASHGFFLEGACQPHPAKIVFDMEERYIAENPLLLSGLFLAGANLHGRGADSLGAEDGILTAYEVSAMDFEGTELVVLSACETGLGEIQQGEGVYGLRRAFQMAGARTVISALWPVGDRATAEMMGRLHDRGDETFPERMRRIQLEKINELRTKNEVDHPYSWGAFIALGDWR